MSTNMDAESPFPTMDDVRADRSRKGRALQLAISALESIASLGGQSHDLRQQATRALMSIAVELGQ